MAKKITVGLAVTADTSKAKAQLQDLQNQLNNIIKATSFDTQKLGITGDLNEAARAAAELKVHIEGAMNAHTGTLDFTKLNQSIKNSGTSLQAYSNKLLSIGPAGEKAFISLANAVASSEIPLKRANKLIDGFWENLRKTAGWQVSSTAINTMVGSIQKAYGYAEDLNKSLNDIRVVTGQSADQMADFAAKANKAAKQLSATTLDYTEAALIYYQQGLEEEDVLKRTDVTIKMANVTGENAADVSSYMTAIWNNFDNGSKSLEYFGDVITALGAETAASSEEIAGGLEKFAAIGETVGLSYEYATAAVTTIIDKTRQSEDVVGNALKTIFARIQGLQLGETQEDGVTLNKYSEALQKVGISILDSTGQMKEMDIILDELGGKWNMLSEAQQTALAQTVGGTRQYAQLIALMDNWSSFQDNLDVAYGSTGTLQEQADIYAESWEAARDRVQAAAEGLYDSLIDDDFFIGALNVIEDLITGVERLVDGMGGLGGVVSTLGAVFTQVFNKQISDTISTMAYNIKMSTKAGQESVRAERTAFLKDAAERMVSQEDVEYGRDSLVASHFEKELTLQSKLVENAHLMSETELKTNQTLLDRYKILSNNSLEMQKQTQSANDLYKKSYESGLSSIYSKTAGTISVQDVKKEFIDRQKMYNDQLTQMKRILKIEQQLNTKDFSKESRVKASGMLNTYSEKLGYLKEDSDSGTIIKDKTRANIWSYQEDVADEQTGKIALNEQIRQLKNNFKENLTTLGLNNQQIDDLMLKFSRYNELKLKSNELTKQEKREMEELEKIIENATGAQMRFSDVVTQTANALMSFSAIINSIKGIVNVLEDDSLSGWEKFVSILGSIGMLIPNIMMLTNAIVTLNSAESQRVIITNISTLAEKLDTWAKKRNTTATIADTVATKANTEAEKENGMVTLTLGQAMTKLKGSILANLPALGMLALKIAAVVAVGWIIVKVFEQIKNSTPEGKLKALNEEAEKAKKAAEETVNAYKNLKSSLDELESSRDTLSQLKEGTLEWKQAILELNQQVLNLLEKYPELNKYLSRDENGILSISEEGMDAVLNTQLSEANALQQAALERQRKIREEEYKQFKQSGVNYEQLEINKGGNEIKYGNYIIDAQGQMNISKAIKENNAFKEDGVTIDWNKMPETFQRGSEEYKKAIQDNIDSILALEETMKQWDSEMQNINENLAASWLDTTTLGAGIDNAYKEALSIGMSKVADEDRENIEKEVNKLKEDEIYKAYSDITGKDINEIKQAIKNEEYTLDDLKTAITNNAVQTEAYLKVQDQVDSLNLTKGEGSDILKRIIASGGDLSSYDNLTADEVDKLKGVLTKSVINELDAAEGGLEALLGEKFGTALKTAIDNYDQAAVDEKRYQQKLSSTASSLGVDEEALESYVSYLTESNEELKENRELAIEAAEANIKFSNAAEKIHEVLEDNEDIFAAADESSWEYHEAIGKLTEAVGGLFGLEVDSGYVKDHFDDIKKAINGDEEALRNLQETVAVDWAKNFVNSVQDVESEALELSDELKKELDLTDGFNAEEWKDRFTEVIDDVASRLANSDDFTIEVDAETDKALADLIDLTNQAMAAGQMTEAQMKSMFASMGYTPEVDYIDIPGQKGTIEGDITIGDKDSPIKLSKHWSTSYDQKMSVPIIKDADNSAGGKPSLTKISSPKMMASAAKKAPKSSGSSKDSKSMKKESERYHVIKEVIKDINHELDKLGDAKDRAFGSKKLKAINDETAALESLLAAEKQYKKEVEDYYKKDKAAIAAYGAKFDENGIITNYEDLIQQQVNKYNASKTDEAEKAYEKFKEALEQYEETHDLLQDQEKKIRDAENKIRDNILEGIQAKVDIQIEVNDDDIAFLDHLLGNLEDSAYDAAEAIAYLGQQTAANLKSNEAYIQGINDIFASQGVADAADRFISGELTAADLKEMEFTEDEVAALKEYRDGLMETTEQLQELRDTIWEEVMESLEELSEEFDEQSDVVDHLSGVLDHYKNIVDIVGQEALGISDDMMKMFSDVAVDSAIDNLAISVNKLEGLREARAEQERALAQATTDEEIKRWTETIEETDKLIRDAEENMLSSWEEALEAAAKAFEETVTRAISNFEKAMSGTFGNLDALQDAFDKQKELDDLYLDDYKQIYELSKLTRDINKSIDDIDNLAGKEALRDILTEINQLQEDGVELSEYDLNFLRAKYELRLAEIALEEAQNAKSQVRMTRDSEGNWSYTYTADQENIDTATQNYEDKLYAIQELSSNYIEEMESQILGLNQAMLDEIAGLDQNATDYMEQVNRITAFYQEKMTAYNDQINNALSNNKEIYDNDWTNYSNATGYKISANEDFIDNFAETTLSMLTGFQDMESYQQAFNDAIGHPDIEDSLLGQLTAGYNEWKNRVEIVMNEAGTSTDQFGKHMEDMAIKVDETTDFAALAAEALKKDMDTVFDGIVSKVKTFEDSYGNAIDNLVQKNAALAGKLNEVFAAWSHVTSESGKALQVAKDYSQYAGKTNLEELVDLINQAGGMSSVNNTSSGSSKYIIDPSTQTGVRPTRMATGGYTGEWGPSGRWALLDEKELVLNASDTKNMLSIIGAVRDISRTIDLNTNGFGLGALVASGISSSESTLNQNVEIHAEFPNATNRGEIEAAFDNLINRASQYTNRKN